MVLRRPAAAAVGAAQLQLLPHRAAALHLHVHLPALHSALDVPREEAGVSSPPPHTHDLAPDEPQSARVPAVGAQALRTRLQGLRHRCASPCTHAPGSPDMASEQRARARRHKVKPVRLLGLRAHGVHRSLLLRPQRRRCAAASGAWWWRGVVARWRSWSTVGHRGGAHAAVSSMRFPPAAWRVACTRAVAAGRVRAVHRLPSPPHPRGCAADAVYSGACI